MSPTPHTSLRWRVVIGSTVAACFATIYWWFPDSPDWGMPCLGVIFVVSNIALPSAMWVQITGLCRRAVRARRHQEPTPPAEDPEDLAQRERFHLDPAEYDARIQIGMPLGHLERLAYRLPNPAQWDDLEASIWPDGEWVGVIEEHRREDGWKP